MPFMFDATEALFNHNKKYQTRGIYCLLHNCLKTGTSSKKNTIGLGDKKFAGICSCNLNQTESN